MLRAHMESSSAKLRRQQCRHVLTTWSSFLQSRRRVREGVNIACTDGNQRSLALAFLVWRNQTALTADAMTRIREGTLVHERLFAENEHLRRQHDASQTKIEGLKLELIRSREAEQALAAQQVSLQTELATTSDQFSRVLAESDYVRSHLRALDEELQASQVEQDDLSMSFAPALEAMKESSYLLSPEARSF